MDDTWPKLLLCSSISCSVIFTLLTFWEKDAIEAAYRLTLWLREIHRVKIFPFPCQNPINPRSIKSARNNSEDSPHTRCLRVRELQTAWLLQTPVTQGGVTCLSPGDPGPESTTESVSKVVKNTTLSQVSFFPLLWPWKKYFFPKLLGNIAFEFNIFTLLVITIFLLWSFYVASQETFTFVFSLLNRNNIFLTNHTLWIN